MNKPYVIREEDSANRLQVFTLKMMKAKENITIADHSIPFHFREHEYRYHNNMYYFLEKRYKVNRGYQDGSAEIVHALRMMRDIVALIKNRKWQIVNRPWVNNKINIKLLVNLNKANKKYPSGLYKMPEDKLQELIDLA